MGATSYVVHRLPWQSTLVHQASLGRPQPIHSNSNPEVLKPRYNARMRIGQQHPILSNTTRPPMHAATVSFMCS